MTRRESELKPADGTADAPPAKWSKLAIVSFVLSLVAPVLYFGEIVVGVTGALVLPAIVAVMAWWAGGSIKISKPKMRGKWFANAAFVIASLSMVIMSCVPIATPRQRRLALDLLCKANRHEIHKALTAYWEEHGQFPDANRWCDVLIDNCSMDESFFECPLASNTEGKARCHYAMNPDCNAASASDVVLLFEAKGGWNQHGGPELAVPERHGYLLVMYRDLSIESVEREDFGKLRWKGMARLEVGDKAPGFALLDQNGAKISLEDFAGKKVLVYFYPRADTPGCTRQACSIRDSAAQLAEAGAAALGISPDEPAAQKKFDEKYELGFCLLCDTEHKVAERYGVWGEKNMYGQKKMGIIRSSFLIDEKGMLIGVWYKVKPEETVPRALEAMGL